MEDKSINDFFDIIYVLSVRGYKIYLLSRPEVSIKRRLNHYPKLLLQDLTKGDIRTLIFSKLD